MLLGTAHHFAIGSGAFREGRVFSNFEGISGGGGGGGGGGENLRMHGSQLLLWAASKFFFQNVDL